MKFIGILFSLTVAVTVFALGLFYYRPEAFVWLTWHDMSDTGDSIVLEYEAGNPSIRVGNGKIVSQEQYELSFPFSGKVYLYFPSGVFSAFTPYRSIFCLLKVTLCSAQDMSVFCFPASYFTPILSYVPEIRSGLSENEKLFH